MSQGPLAAFFYHFDSEHGDNHAALLREVRHAVLHQAAHLWFRLVVPMTGYPFRLCRLVDVRLTTADQEAVATDVFSAARCCFDPDFTLKAAQKTLVVLC